MSLGITCIRTEKRISYLDTAAPTSAGIVDLSKRGNSAFAAAADNGMSPFPSVVVAVSAMLSSLSCENELERRETVWPTSFMPPPMALLVARNIVVEAAMTAVSACSAREGVDILKERDNCA